MVVLHVPVCLLIECALLAWHRILNLTVVTDDSVGGRRQRSQQQMDYTQFTKFLIDDAVIHLHQLVGEMTILNATVFEDFTCDNGKEIFFYFLLFFVFF